MNHQILRQALVVQSNHGVNPNTVVDRVAFYNEDGTPATFNSSLQAVAVVTGEEERPDGAVIVFWVGGEEQPENMIDGDVWFAAEPTEPGVPPTITTTVLDELVEDEEFSQTLVATGDITIIWTVTTGSLPAGLDLDSAGVLSGTPTTAGAYSFTVTATNDEGNDTQAYSGTVESAAPSGLSIFSSTVPDADTIYNDGGGSLRTANFFYGTVAWTLLGVRVWNPPEADSTLLNTDLTVYAYARDYLGVAFNQAFSGLTAAMSKTHTAERVANTWTEIYFDSPLAINAINSGANSPDIVMAAVQYAGGNYYIITTDASVTNSSRESDNDDNIYFAETGVPRGGNSLEASTSTWYGLDIIYELA